MIDGALLESPVSRTHTHAAACTDERAATYTSENELWVKIGRVRKSTFHFQRTSSCATSRGHLRPRPFRPLSSFFRPLLPRRALALSAAFVFGSPPPLAAAPATGGLCMLWHRRNSPVFQRPTAAPTLFNARRMSRNCATRSLSRASARCLSFHSRANFSRFFRNEATSFARTTWRQVCLAAAEHKLSCEPFHARGSEAALEEAASWRSLPARASSPVSTVFARLEPLKGRATNRVAKRNSAALNES